ncbi:hypothetical protein GX586_12530 [bacterium]|nr:hypothetical protein [bacterium]
MAVLTKSVSTGGSPWEIEETPPKGTFVSTCIDIKDEFGVERPKFDKPQEIEKIDRTAFLFGFRDRSGKPYKISTRWMKISGNEKSSLFQFLRQWLGEPFPFGKDYAAKAPEGMLGHKALITISHEPRKDGSGVFPQIVSICPEPEQAPQAAAPTPQPGNGGAHALDVHAAAVARDPLPF